MNFAGMLKQAQDLQKKMAEAQKAVEAIEAEGSAGAGMVIVNMNGKHEVSKVSISEDLLKPSEKEILEDLLIAALSDAHRKISEAAASTMQGATAGLNLPKGMGLPF